MLNTVIRVKVSSRFAIRKKTYEFCDDKIVDLLLNLASIKPKKIFKLEMKNRDEKILQES